MPFLKTNGTEIHYQFDDFGNDEVLIFSNSLGTDLSMWDKQVESLNPHFNILRYDTRGHGESQIAPRGRNFTIENLGQDVLALMDKLKIEKAHFCGLSMGGLIGQWLGINASHRFETITIANTAAKIGTTEGWNDRIEHVSKEGLASITPALAYRWFTRPFFDVNAQLAIDILVKFKNTNLEGYISCCAAIRDADFREQLHNLKASTLVISGSEDPVTTVEEAEFLAEKIPVSKHITFLAAHLSNVEQAEAFSKAILVHTKQ